MATATATSSIVGNIGFCRPCNDDDALPSNGSGLMSRFGAVDRIDLEAELAELERLCRMKPPNAAGNSSTMRSFCECCAPGVTDEFPLNSNFLFDIETLTGSASWENPETPTEKSGNRKSTSATAVSPTMHADSSESRAVTFDDDELKPIRLDDFADKKIAAITEGCGNFIEDVDCDESFAGSVMTMIASEQSSSCVDVKEFLEDVFLSDDENEYGDDRGTSDHARTANLGDNCESKKTSNSNADKDNFDVKNVSQKENLPRSRTRPKTSRINPMTGERSLTDDMREWRNNALSSSTVSAPPSPKSRKYNTRKVKRETALKNSKLQHSYPTRSGNKNTTSTDIAANMEIEFEPGTNTTVLGKIPRELNNLVPFDRPRIKDLYANRSSLSKIQCSDASNSINSSLMEDASLEMDFGSNSNVLTNDERFLAKQNTTELHVSVDTKTLVNAIPEKEFEISDKSTGSVISSREIRKRKGSTSKPLSNNCAVEQGKTTSKNAQAITSTNGESDSKGIVRSPSSVREEGDLDPHARKKRKTNHDIQINGAAASIRITRRMKNNTPNQINESAKNKSCSVKRKQEESICRQPEPQSASVFQKEIEPLADAETTYTILSRIAKKFVFNPTQRKGRDKMKLYFGTIVSKRIEEEADGPCNELWHVLYDDGDEEDFDVIDLKEALDLYKSAKRWDKKRREQQQPAAGEYKGEAKDNVHSMEKARESVPYECLKQSKKENRPPPSQRSRVTISKAPKPFEKKGKDETLPPDANKINDSNKGQHNESHKKSKGRNPSSLHKSTMPMSECPRPRRKVNEVLSSSERSKHSSLKQGRQLRTRSFRERPAYRVSLSSNNVQPIEISSDEDSVQVFNALDLRRNDGKVGGVVDIVDLTIN